MPAPSITQFRKKGLVSKRYKRYPDQILQLISPSYKTKTSTHAQGTVTFNGFIDSCRIRNARVQLATHDEVGGSVPSMPLKNHDPPLTSWGSSSGLWEVI